MPAGAQYQHDSDALVEGLEGNTLRYAKLLAEAADEVMPEPSEDLALADAIDVLHQQARWRPARCWALWPFRMRGLGHKHLVDSRKPLPQMHALVAIMAIPRAWLGHKHP